MASIVQERRRLKAEIKNRRRVVLTALKEALKRSKTARKKRLKVARSVCRKARAETERRAVLARRELEKAIRRAQAEAKKTCSICKVVDKKGLEEISARLEAISAERDKINKLRAQASSLISERGRAGGRRAAEKRAESDEQVIVNLAEDQNMIELFKKVRGKIKASPHRTRTEAFFEFVHDNPSELDELIATKENAWEREAERMFKERQPDEPDNSNWNEIDKLQAEVEQLKRVEAHLADVPF